MTEQQSSKPWIPKLTAALVEHQSAFGALTTEDAQLVIQQTKPAIALFVAAIKNRAFKAKTRKRSLRILKPAEPSPAKIFSVNDTFLAKKSPAIHFSFIGSNFRLWFAGSKTESVFAAPLNEFYLPKPVNERAIIDDLGSENAAQVNLFDLWEKIRGGTLRRDGIRYFSFVKDENGVLRVVRVYWRDDGWDIDAFIMMGSALWTDIAAIRIFTRA